MNILGIGEVVIDKYEHPGVAADVDPERHIGGPVLAALVVLSRLGLPCKFVTSLGGDAHGEIIRHTLRREHITLIDQPLPATKVNRIIVNATDGQRTKIRGRQPAPAIQAIDAALIQAADLILFDRHEPALFRQVMRQKQPGTIVIIDPSTEVSDHTLAMIAGADYPIVPIESCALLSPHDDLLSGLHALHSLNSGMVVVTAGDLGSVIYDGSTIELVPGLDLQAVDTCGAGDVFRAGFAYGLTQGWGPGRCARFANYLGGLQCLTLGNLAAIPSRHVMLHHRRQHPTRPVSLADVGARFREIRREHPAAAQPLPNTKLVGQTA